MSALLVRTSIAQAPPTLVAVAGEIDIALPPRCAVTYCLSPTAAPSWNYPGCNCSPLRA